MKKIDIRAVAIVAAILTVAIGVKVAISKIRNRNSIQFDNGDREDEYDIDENVDTDCDREN